jgi:DNA-binding response OmpR family regulator
MRPLAEIRRLQRENAALRAQLRAADIEPMTCPDWAVGLTRQEAALIGALRACYPRVMDRLDIDEALPHHDHAADRDLGLASILIHRVRKKLGHDAIENIRGHGWRLSAAFATHLDAAAASDPGLSAVEFKVRDRIVVEEGVSPTS